MSIDGGDAGHGLTFAQMRALGPLAPLVMGVGVRDVVVQVRDGAGEVWVDSGEGLTLVRDLAPGPEQLRGLAVRVIAEGGRQLDELHPFANVRFGRGIRVHALLAPLADEGAALSIRVPAAARPTFARLVSDGLCTTWEAARLCQAVNDRANLLITGATGSGKTTLLAALIDEASPHERIITIEDVHELQLRHPHHLALQSRQPNAEGVGEVPLATLVAESLRMRPDRIVVGECRGSEIVPFMTALNTGHRGGAGTLHANGVHEVPARLEALGMLGSMNPEALAKQAVAAFDLVIHLEREGPRHRLAGIAQLSVTSTGALTTVLETEQPRSVRTQLRAVQ